MEDLRIARGVRQDADDKTEDAVRRRRHSVTAASGRLKRHKTREYRAPRRPIDPIVITLIAGLAAEVAVPWAVVWLSDALLFDVPAWSLWLIFGVPPAVTVLAVLIQGAIRMQGWHPMSLPISAHQRR